MMWRLPRLARMARAVFARIAYVAVAMLPAIFTSLTVASSAHASSMFMGLGTLTAGPSFSTGLDVSSDGSTVVGSSVDLGSGTSEAYVWTLGGGMVGLGGSEARGVSSDGSVIVGRSGGQAFRWTSAGGMVDLGNLGGSSAAAADVSADGSVVAGFSSLAAGGTEAFRWTQSSGMVGLGELPGGGVSASNAFGISGDGLVVVGEDNVVSGVSGFRWTQGGGMEALALTGGVFNTSFDGSVIVGIGVTGEAIRWTEATGAVGMGVLPGGLGSVAQAVSQDGSIIVGFSDQPTGDEPFIWDESNGMRSLHELLEVDLGLDLTGWALDDVGGISADGRVIVGTGINPAGLPEAWIAVIPEPATGILLALGLLLAAQVTGSARRVG